MVCAMLMLPFLLLLQGPQTQSQSLVKVYPCFVDPSKSLSHLPDEDIANPGLGPGCGCMH